MVGDVRDALEKGAHEVPPGWTWEWFTDVMDVEGGRSPLPQPLSILLDRGM